MTPMPRKKGPIMPLRIDTPAQSVHIPVVIVDSELSALSSATSESDSPPFHPLPKPPSLRNMKKLSLTLTSAQSSTNSLQITSEPSSAVNTLPPPLPRVERLRRPSVISLPSTATPTVTALLNRKEDGGDPGVPYADGPTQILPGIWLGSEDNARDWNGLIERGIKSILNVAKEVASPFDSAGAQQALRYAASTPDLTAARESSSYFPPHPATGRPGMHYLKLQWSHGQQDLVDNGFQAAMSFTDAAIERAEGVLIHCQCGISRSATMVIALVMRAAAERSPSVPSEIWALKGMQGAYTYVKEKSKWVGPNMSLIYQLLDYERKLKGDIVSPSASDRSSAIADEEEEWGRRRRMLDEAPSEDDERESTYVIREAQALDKAMEERVIARKSSASSVASSNSGVGMGAAWRSRYSNRKRAGSVASNRTAGSTISEDLVEEDEEQELLNIGGGFDEERLRSSSAEPDSTESNSPANDVEETPQRRIPFTPNTARPPLIFAPPPSAPVSKLSFTLPPPPATAVRATFNLPPRLPKPKRRPPPINLLPPVPPSPVSLLTDGPQTKLGSSNLAPPSARLRTESRKPAPPPLHLRSMMKRTTLQPPPIASTPSQTFFVFPPSPTARTPSTMTLTSNVHMAVPFPSISTPRVATFRSHGRTRSFIGVATPLTPTVAFSKVDARGYIGLEA